MGIYIDKQEDAGCFECKGDILIYQKFRGFQRVPLGTLNSGPVYSVLDVLVQSKSEGP